MQPTFSLFSLKKERKTGCCNCIMLINIAHCHARSKLSTEIGASANEQYHIHHRQVKNPAFLNVSAIICHFLSSVRGNNCDVM